MSLFIRYVPNSVGGGGGGGGVTSVGALDGNTASADGASIVGAILYMQSASTLDAGLVNTGTQSFAGNKTFTGTIGAANLSGTNTGDVTLGTANGLSLVNQVLSLALSSTSTTGALSSTDWNTFNGKQAAGNYITALTGDGTASGPGSAALTLATVNANVGSFTLANITVNAKGLITAASSTATGNLTDVGTDGIVVTGGTGAVIGSGTSIAQHVADTTHNGYLSSTDWNTFNGKQAAGNYITALTGDVAASGPGSAAASIQPGVIVNSMVSASAAIAYSKLALTGSIVNADISASAAIAYSKLNLTGSIVNADISASAAIAFSKLATLTSANILVGNVSNVAAAVAVTGDISLSNAGVTAYSGIVPKAKGGTNQDNSSLTFPSSGTIPAITPVNHGVMISSGTAAANVTSAGTSGQVLTSNGASADPTFQTAAASIPQSLEIKNLGLSTSVTTGALTIALKQQDGSTDPSSGTAAVTVGMRSSTAASGAYNERSATAALNLVLSQQSTAGLASGTAAWLYIWLIDSDGAGTLKMGASNLLLDEGSDQTAVKESDTVTITIASPGVLTVTGNNYANGDKIRLTNSGGALPTGLSVNTDYYIVNNATDGANKFRLATTPSGTAINTSGSQSGTHTIHICCSRSILSDGYYATKPVRMVGRLAVTQTTGSYAAPSEIALMPFELRKIVAQMTLGTSQSGIANSTFTQANLDTVIYDNTGICDTTNHRFIIPTTGKYKISTYASLSGNAPTRSLVLAYKNGTKIIQADTGSSGNVGGGGFVQILSLTAGDYIELWARVTTGNATTWAISGNDGGGVDSTAMTIEQVDY